LEEEYFKKIEKNIDLLELKAHKDALTLHDSALVIELAHTNFKKSKIKYIKMSQR
jgi:hypothetical protein